MSDRADLLTILNHKVQVDDDAIVRAAAQYERDMPAWIQGIVVATYALRTAEDKVPALSSAHRIAILRAAADYLVRHETREDVK